MFVFLTFDDFVNDLNIEASSAIYKSVSFTWEDFLFSDDEFVFYSNVELELSLDVDLDVVLF